MTTLLVLSLKGTAVALLVAAALAFASRLRIEVPAFLRHALWLIVFVRLLVPVLPASPASLLSLGAPLEATGGGLLPGLDLDRLARIVAGGGNADSDPDGEVASGTTRTGIRGGIETAAAIVWAVGFLALGLRAALEEIRLRRCLRGAVPVTDPRVLAVLDDARRLVGVPPGVRILESARIAAPAIHGALRPRILLPADAARVLGAEALRHALLHEIAHVRRWDGTTRLLARVAVVVHWFNPLAWYALGRLEAECELACDAAVLERLAERERTGYGRTLLHAATLGSPASTDFPGGLDRLEGAVTALPLSTHQTLKRRIQMIARYRSPSRPRLAALRLAAGALAFVALTDAPLRAAPAPDAAAGATREDDENLKETLQSMRNGGTAMFAWITDAMMESGAVTQEEVTAGADGAGEEESAEPESYAWAHCPPATYEELRELLVPTYIEELPRADGWGHPLAFCLDKTPADADHMIAGIRSPGRDGKFDGGAYTPGPFPPSAVDRDVVWIDGFFVNWPSKDAGE